MPGREQVETVVREWTKKAENDLVAAAQLLKSRRRCPTDAACFHAQQCVEKYLKALLVSRGVEFPKTHDVGQLLARLPEGPTLSLTVADQQRLTGYATVTRYPGDYEPISLAEARKAVALARAVQRQVQAALALYRRLRIE
jgi:HEPN domain-containing protein